MGLGNPGPAYQDTRHNAGFWFIDNLCRQYGLSLLEERRAQGLVGRITIGGEPCRVLMPGSFMNRSGYSVAALAGYFRIVPEEILVVHDDLDLEPGTIRVKRGGGHGGHNGLRDIIAQLGSREFLRLRVGIGHPGQRDDVVDYVLSRPSRADREAIVETLEQALEQLPKIVTGDIAAAQRQLHTSRG